MSTLFEEEIKKIRREILTAVKERKTNVEIEQLLDKLELAIQYQEWVKNI